MGHPGIKMWTWTLCLLSWMCVDQVLAGPQYMVVIPAVLEAGAEAKFCASLLQPSKTLVMTVTLISKEKSTRLLKQTSTETFHSCFQFKAPFVHKEEVQKFEVEVRGGTFYSKQIKKVMIRAYQPMTFIQTNKPIYIPGQTVHFRVVTLDTKFRPANPLYNTITIEDVKKNRIAQWLNETSDSKILQLSYSLNSEAREGNYSIIVGVGEGKVYHNFKVEKYVLPKFNVKLDAPDEVSIAQEEIKAEVCAKYTYGQPVPGSVKVEVCRPPEHHGIAEAPCYKETKKMDKKGCATFSFNMSYFPEDDQIMFLNALDFRAKVEEEGTGISHTQEKKIGISYVVGKLYFIDTPKVYHKGSNVEGKIKAVYYNNTPIPDMPVYLFEWENWSLRQLQALTTHSDGVATFSLNTAGYNRDINLRVKNTPSHQYQGESTAHYEAGEHRLSLVQLSAPVTKTVSSLKVQEKNKPLSCDMEETILIQYTIIAENQGSVGVMCLVLSRGAIALQELKYVEVQEKAVNEGQVSFNVTVIPDMAPEIQVMAYAVLPSKKVITAAADFPTEKCFNHKVSLEFSRSSAVPREETTIQVTADPESLCGVSTVDQSILIKEPGKSLDADKIFNLLPVRKLSNVPFEVRDRRKCPIHAIGRNYIFDFRRQGNNIYTVFQKRGLQLATNVPNRSPPCTFLERRPYLFHHYDPDLIYMHSYKRFARRNRIYGKFSRSSSTNTPPVVTIHSFFPETWIWDLMEVGESGTRDVSLTVPDTITTWETEAFCLSPRGFGLAHRNEITVFQPFFLELILPYSIIRGEHFELNASIFNYLNRCFMVSVTPEPSSDYTLTPLSGDHNTFCLCSNERKILSWTMVPSSLGTVNVSVTAEAVVSYASCDNEIVNVPDRGRINVVKKSLIVKAEGTETTNTYNRLLCPKRDGLTEEINIHLPGNVIDGSARASLSVLGDVLGRALNNLDGLLQMPFGCGEQNMARLASNIYILQYLKDTHQLTPAIIEKATEILTSGYQRQLNYEHYDGTYSPFGSGAGNTWLTAFVLRSFAKAQSFIYIDPTKIEEAKTWLEVKQQENGCFEQSGKFFNNRMRGGVSDEVTLSAYITAAFLEMNVSADTPVVRKSLLCLKKSINDLSNTYTTALLAYVFTLAGDMETRAHLLQHLDSVALDEGGFLHWSQTATETSASLSVEISSYVLLAKLSASPTAEDLGYSSRIVRWLTGQQNHYGGFSSTQDTVVALQALALYSTLVFSPEGSSTVTVQSPSGQLTFDVNQDNKLLYQEKMLQDVTGKYSLEVKGSACASVQLSLHYNIPPPADVFELSVEVKPEANCSSMSHRPKLTVKFTYLYSGKESSTNMVILDVKMLSGFVPHPESLRRLQHASLVDRVEQKEDRVLVYIRELTKDTPINHSLELVQEVPVQSLKPAVVQIYDYYQPSDQAETEYIYPCAAA
ncbi:alpha-2-macroglobulin-like [Channa argus]|uniref:alpha-2-macroglobulin-like n=1 Tax=Channa argus TaxID=215402 RepID=UPI0035214454